MKDGYRLVNINMYRYTGDIDIPAYNICKACLYTDIPIKQLEIALNSNDIVIKKMIFKILESTNLEKSYITLYRNIDYLDKLHPNVDYKIKVYEN